MKSRPVERDQDGGIAAEAANELEPVLCVLRVEALPAAQDQLVERALGEEELVRRIRELPRAENRELISTSLTRKRKECL